MVLIYEQKSGEVGVGGKRVDGGRGGIVACAKVAGSWKERSAANEFTLEAECIENDYEGFVPLSDISPVLGYKDGFQMHGVGGGSGLRAITEEQYQMLHRTFESNQRR